MLPQAEKTRQEARRQFDEVKATVEGVLQATGFAEQRASKMDHDDFLLLLARFNQAGVHFSS